VEATLASIVFSASPLVYAAVGETIGEKAGVVNLSMEGTLMLAALTAFVTTLFSHSVVLGFLAAMGVGAIFAAVIAFASIELRLNQIAVGFVLALLGIALSTFIGDGFTGRVGKTVPHFAIGGLSKIPFVGGVLFDQDFMVYGSYLAIIVAAVFLFGTRRGLELQGVGERPEAAFARGIAVNRLRYLYTVIGGSLAGAGGAAFSLDVILGWRAGLTQNFGWIALAIVIFGGWNPIRAAVGAYLFGTLEVVALKLQSHAASVSQVLPFMPFVVMILILILIYLPAFRRAADRHPMLRRVVAGDPPSALGTAFAPE
jgi:general nucleoside transport system permease protein